MANSGIIVKVNARNKVLDFRDSLSPALVEDYASLHGVGGKNHARNSVIKLYICDYTKGTGTASVTVSANITPELCEQLCEVCRGNIGSTVIPGNLAPLETVQSISTKVNQVGDLCYGVVSGVIRVLSRFVEVTKSGGSVPAPALAEGLNALLIKARDRQRTAQPVTREPLVIPRHTDFTYTQDRVHNFGNKLTSGGLAPVQRLQIWHATYRKDGQPSRYPWTVKIINGRAPVNVTPTGATTFSASAMTDITEAFIQVSDSDMFRAMCRVTHYIRVWENLAGSRIVDRGIAAREKEWRSDMRNRRMPEETQANETQADESADDVPAQETE